MMGSLIDREGWSAISKVRSLDVECSRVLLLDFWRVIYPSVLGIWEYVGWEIMMETQYGLDVDLSLA